MNSEITYRHHSPISFTNWSPTSILTMQITLQISLGRTITNPTPDYLERGLGFLPYVLRPTEYAQLQTGSRTTKIHFLNLFALAFFFYR